MYGCKIEQMDSLLAGIAEHRRLYLPKRQEGRTLFAVYEKEASWLDEAGPVDQSPKELFFPQTEALMRFQSSQGTLMVQPVQEETEPFVLFGVRGCDEQALRVLDRVFLAEPADSYYTQRRQQGLIVTMGCGSFSASCFCRSFGIDPIQPGGDVRCWKGAEWLTLEPLTEKGETWLTELQEQGVIRTLSAEEENRVRSDTQEEQNRAAEQYERLPFAGLTTKKLPQTEQEVFSLPLWEEEAASCLGCGTCTFVCPTCQCYDIRDYDTGHGVERYRCWDSCMYSDFTRMAGGQPRTTQTERFRQRFLHKLVYFPENQEGRFACVGCGRCVKTCPVHKNIVRMIRRLSSE